MSEIILSRKIFSKNGIELKSAMFLPDVVGYKSPEKQRVNLSVMMNVMFSFTFNAKDAGSDYWADRRFTVNSKNLFKVKRFFGEIYDKFTDPKHSLFITDETGKHVNSEFENFRAIRTTVFETSHYGKCMIADPSCEDIDGTMYEGIYLTINYQTNVSFLPWPDLDELNCIVQELDCNHEATMLMTSLQIAKQFNTLVSSDEWDIHLRELRK